MPNRHVISYGERDASICMQLCPVLDVCSFANRDRLRVVSTGCDTEPDTAVLLQHHVAHHIGIRCDPGRRRDDRPQRAEAKGTAHMRDGSDVEMSKADAAFNSREVSLHTPLASLTLEYYKCKTRHPRRDLDFPLPPHAPSHGVSHITHDHS